MICGRRFFLDHHVCKREPHEYGLHRNHPVLRFATVVWGDGDCAKEEQPEKAEATVATYRVHMIVMVQGDDQPRSFRTEERAADFEDAWQRADQSLATLAHAEGWTGMYEVLSRASCERVPGTEQHARKGGQDG